MGVGAAKVKLRYFFFNPLTLPAHIADLEQNKTDFQLSSYDGFGCTRAFGPWENRLPRQGKKRIEKSLSPINMIVKTQPKYCKFMEHT